MNLLIKSLLKMLEKKSWIDSRFLMVFTLVFLLNQIEAQSDQIKRHYSTNAFYNEFLAETGSGTEMEVISEYYQNKETILQQVEQMENEMKIDTQLIHLVFHILYTDSIERTQQIVQSQLDALNRDFSGQSQKSDHPNDPEGKFERLAKAANLHFELANTDQDSTYGKGIVVIKESSSHWNDWQDMKKENKGGSAALSPSITLNIWVCSLPEEYGSYATRPYWSDDNDGIVLDYRLFGIRDSTITPFYQGKTLTHLIGNFLGLDPLWGPGGYCTDDGIEDTPIHNAPNVGSPQHTHISACPSHIRRPEMVMNFMDSTNDAVQTMFTEGQVRRMHAMLTIARPGLIQSP